MTSSPLLILQKATSFTSYHGFGRCSHVLGTWVKSSFVVRSRPFVVSPMDSALYCIVLCLWPQALSIYSCGVHYNAFKGVTFYLRGDFTRLRCHHAGVWLYAPRGDLTRQPSIFQVRINWGSLSRNMVHHPILPDTSLAKWLPEEVLPVGMLDCEIFPRLIFYGSPSVPAQEERTWDWSRSDRDNMNQDPRQGKTEMTRRIESY